MDDRRVYESVKEGLGDFEDSAKFVKRLVEGGARA